MCIRDRDVTGGKFSSDVKEFVPEGNTTDTDLSLIHI